MGALVVIGKLVGGLIHLAIFADKYVMCIIERARLFAASFRYCSVPLLISAHAVFAGHIIVYWLFCLHPHGPGHPD